MMNRVRCMLLTSSRTMVESMYLYDHTHTMVDCTQVHSTVACSSQSVPSRTVAVPGVLELVSLGQPTSEVHHGLNRHATLYSLQVRVDVMDARESPKICTGNPA
jgi:hypothetical protein